jgi:hypothetical protein
MKNNPNVDQSLTKLPSQVLKITRELMIVATRKPAPERITEAHVGMRKSKA